MNPIFIIAFVVLLVPIFASRMIMANAIKKLTDEQKARLLSNKDINRGMIRSVITLAVLGLFYYLIMTFPQYSEYMLWVFLAVVAITRVYSFFYAKKRIKELELPAPYLKSFVTASVVTNLGLILFLATILYIAIYGVD